MAMDPKVLDLIKGMLGLKLWVVISRPSAPFDQMANHLVAHLEHQVRLERQGILFTAGPCSRPGESDPEFGLIVIRAADETEARRIADSDPMHAAGVRAYELYEWTVNEGQLRISLNFSNQTLQVE
jgi:uncharacterized protein